MPGCCGTPELQPTNVRPAAALSLLWLADTVHVVGCGTATGNVASRSPGVHIVLRLAVAARTRATSLVEMKPPRLPKLLRTYDPTAAIQASVCWPIGIMTCVYVLPASGPFRPWSRAPIT